MGRTTNGEPTPLEETPLAQAEPHGGGLPLAGALERERTEHRSTERALDRAESSRDRFALLAEVSRCLADSLDYETTLATVAGMSLPYFGAWCVVDVCDGPAMRRVAVIHPDPERQPLAHELERYPPQDDDLLGAMRVVAVRRPRVVLDVSDDDLRAAASDDEHLRLLRGLGIRSFVIVPLVARDRVLGAMTFVTAEEGRRYGDMDVVLAQDLASRAAIAVDNARLHAEALEARAAAEQARQDADAARRMAEASSRAKSDFLAMMSHELRTPLNAIAGYTELLTLGLHGPLTEEQRADLARIRWSQQHLLGVIESVLSHAQAEAGALRFDVREVALDETLAACSAIVAPQVALRDIDFRFEGCSPTLRALADPEKLQQIVLNLLSNALKFTERGGRVSLACVERAEGVGVRVSDTGCGIAPDQLERVFEPFVQAEGDSLTRGHGGVGLGLAICRDLARGMGGDVTAQSTPGEGSTFTLVLPRA